MLEIIVMLALVLIIAVAAGKYYNILIKRLISLFTPDYKKSVKIVIIVLSVFLGISSINISGTFGIILLHILAFALIIDALNLIVKKFNSKVWNKIYKSGVIPVCMALSVFIYGYFNIRNVVRTEYTVYTDKDISQDVKILMIADSHYGTIFESEKLLELKSKMDSESADIVVLVGDIVDESTTSEQMKEVFEVFGDINSKYGVYYVYGNHDQQNYVSDPEYTSEELEKTIKDNDIKILVDEYTEITDDIVIAGRNDFSNDRAPLDQTLKDADKNKFIIMLDHQPLDYAENAKQGTDLILSGHTHGGQVFPLGIFINLLKTADFCYGFEKINNLNAVVSSGIAGWGYPIRTEKHSEYVVINVVKNL